MSVASSPDLSLCPPRSRESLERGAETPAPSIPRVKLILTYACNYECVFCYNNLRSARTSISANDLLRPSRSALEAIVDELSVAGVEDVALTGGEPLLFPLETELAVRCLAAHGIYTILCTNLSMLPASWLARLKECGLRGVYSSVYCKQRDLFNEICQKADAYDGFFDNLAQCAEADIPTALNMTVIPETVEKVYETGEHLFTRFGVRNFSASPNFPTSAGQRHLLLGRDELFKIYDQLLALEADYGLNVTTARPVMPCFFAGDERYRQFFGGCGGFRGEVTVLANGDVKMCDSLDMVFGNVLQEQLAEIVRRVSDWILEPGAKGSLLFSGCRSCAALDYCRSGCRSLADVVGCGKDGANPYMGEPLREPISSPSDHDFDILPDFAILPVRVRENHLGDHWVISEEVCTHLDEHELALFSLAKDHPNYHRLLTTFELRPDFLGIFLNKLIDGKLLIPESG